jgi:hypothetical protein
MEENDDSRTVFIADSNSLERLDKLEKLVDIRMKQHSYLCCSGTGVISKNLITYIGQIIIAVALLGFSFYSLTQNQNRELSIGLISGITGYFLPQPKLKEEDEK